VLNGIKTMPPWNGLLTPRQLEALWAYAMSRRVASPGAQAWPCGGDPRLLLDSAGAPVWFTSDQLKSRATSMPAPSPAASAGATGTVTVDVLVDSQGRVKCSRQSAGGAALKSALAEAVMKWTFQPFLDRGQPVAVFGRLDFDLASR
jgi:TonB family protein